MTDQITVPRATWDAMREALDQLIACHDEPTCPAITIATEALTAANAVSVEPKVKLIPTAEEMGAPVEPQLVGCAYYESNGACCESGEPCKADVQNNSAAHPQATEQASCHQTGVCVRSGLAAENHARLIECAKRLVEHADFALGGILSADSKAKDIPSKAVSQVKSRHLAALRDALPAAPEAKQ